MGGDALCSGTRGTNRMEPLHPPCHPEVRSKWSLGQEVAEAGIVRACIKPPILGHFLCIYHIFLKKKKERKKKKLSLGWEFPSITTKRVLFDTLHVEKLSLRMVRRAGRGRAVSGGQRPVPGPRAAGPGSSHPGALLLLCSRVSSSSSPPAAPACMVEMCVTLD